MFCDLNGATLVPLLASTLQSAATTVLLPAWDEVPSTIRDMCIEICMSLNKEHSSLS